MKAQTNSIRMVALVVLCLGTPAAMADIADLTTAGSSDWLNGAYFTWYDARSTGSGVIDPFVRVSTNQGIEEGYNTSYRPLEFDENSSPVFTHTLEVGDVPIVPIGGTNYLEFLLDINQQGSNPLLSLDELKIYVSGDEYIHGYDNVAQTFSSTGTESLVYSLDVGPDGDSWVKLNYNLNTGSGSGDMLAYIPESLFGGGQQYLTLWSSFGQQGGDLINNDGFEEWAVREPTEPPPVIPAPPAVLLGMIGLSFVGVKLRKHV